MSSVVLAGSTSGSVTVQAAAVAGSNTATLGAATGTHYPFTSGTAVASTSGTSIDFTSIPSWVKRITVMFSGVSTSGTSDLRAQLGSGTIATANYATSVARMGAAASFYVQSTTGSAFQITNSILASDAQYGQLLFTNISGNTWSISGSISSATSANTQCMSVGSVTLSGTLDRVRITTVGGSDTFDAGTINLLWEG